MKYMTNAHNRGMSQRHGHGVRNSDRTTAYPADAEGGWQDEDNYDEPANDATYVADRLGRTPRRGVLASWSPHRSSEAAVLNDLDPVTNSEDEQPQVSMALKSSSDRRFPEHYFQAARVTVAAPAQTPTLDDGYMRTPGEVATIGGSLPGAGFPAWGEHEEDHQRHGHVMHIDPSTAQGVNAHVANVQLLPGGRGKAILC